MASCWEPAKGRGRAGSLSGALGFPLHREGWAAQAVRVLTDSVKPGCSPALQAPPCSSWKFLSKWSSGETRGLESHLRLMLPWAGLHVSAL